MPLENISESIYSGSSDPSYLAGFEPVVLNVYYWEIRDQDGNEPFEPLTERIALESIANLNIHYNPIGIFFKFRGLDSFNSPSVDNPMFVVDKIWNYDTQHCDCVIPNAPNDPACQNPQPDPDGFATISRCQQQELKDHILDNDLRIPNALNIYVTRTIDFGGSAFSPTDSLVNIGGIIGATAIHEFGHNFGLSHTHMGWISSSGNGTDPGYQACEHVTRDINDINDPNDDYDTYYNANYAGDKMHGTDAMPEFIREYCALNNLPDSQCNEQTVGNYAFAYYDKDNCEYRDPFVTGRTDCQGTLYQISPASAGNHMSYAPGLCRDNFSTDQVIRMRESIQNYPPLQNVTTDIPSLYEPYKGEYYVAGPVPPHFVPPHFQPGFEYRFVECQSSLSTPMPYSLANTFPYNINNVILNISADEDNYNLILHPNHTAIGIIPPNTPHPGFWPRPKKCYDNWNLAPNSGKIVKFNDDILNANVTVTPQDSTGINNPQLINNLDAGLYKIEKNYLDGSFQETVIYKENNN